MRTQRSQQADITRSAFVDQIINIGRVYTKNASIHMESFNSLIDQLESIATKVSGTTLFINCLNTSIFGLNLFCFMFCICLIVEI